MLETSQAQFQGPAASTVGPTPQPQPLPTANRAHVMGIYERLAARAAATPHKPAFVESKMGTEVARVHSYYQLLIRSDEYARGFQTYGVRSGHRILMLMKPDFEWLAICFALFRLGAVPVFIDPKIGLSRLLKCIGRAGATHLLAESAAYALRLLARSTFAGIRTSFVRDRLPVVPAISLAALRTASGADTPIPSRPPGGDDEVCLIAYTSGSTGTPKGVEWSRRNVITQIDEFHRSFGTGDSDISLCTLPFFAVTGVALGNTCVVPGMDFGAPAKADPAHLVDVIERHRVTYGFGSPALWANLAGYCRQERETVEHMRVAITGGAAISPDFVEDLRQAMPNADVCVTYGATEALLIAGMRSREFLAANDLTQRQPGRGVCVGRPIAGTQVAVIKVADHPLTKPPGANVLPPGAIGEVIVSGPVVSQRYLHAPRANAQAKLPAAPGTPTVDASVWHRTGDAGYLDDSGNLWLCGRLSHRTRSAGETFYPLCAEEIFATHRWVSRSCLVNCQPVPVGLLRRLRRTVATKASTALGLAVQGLRPDDPRAPITIRELFSLARQHQIPISFIVAHPDPFPVDRRHNAKVDRIEVARWAQSHPRAWHYPNS